MDSVAQIGFFILPVIFYYLFYRELRLALVKTTLPAGQQKKVVRIFLIVIFSWLIFVYAWSRTGIFGNFNWFPWNAAPILLIPLILVLIFVFSGNMKQILLHLPQENMIKLQVFRFYVEILLWALFASALLPKQMTFEGLNFDVVTGATATLAAWLITKNKFPKVAIALWNMLGLALLITIVVIAILSMPTPLRYFMNGPANTVITQFPISFLPALLVPLAYMLHLMSLRKLTLKS